MKVVYTRKATNDLNNVFDYLYISFGEKVATEKVFELKHTIDLLGNNSYMGKSISDYDKTLRQFRYGASIIIYQVNSVVEILHIVDARTDYIKNL
jgi:plasmid stabilization system protein ParE